MTTYNTEQMTIGSLGKGYALTTSVGVSRPVLGDPSGPQVVMDFYLKAMLDGLAFQIRAGTITTPLVGDAPLTDTRAEYCVDPPASYTILPVSQMISVRLATGTLHEYATKSVATASSAGTAFTPLPLLTGGAAAVSTARVAAHAVTVTAELATTTRRHWEGANPAAGATGALPTSLFTLEWTPRTPPPIRSRSGTGNQYCLYTQIAATTTGPSYYAHLDFFEFISAALGIS